MAARRAFVVLILGGVALSSCGDPKPIICPPGSVFAPILLSPPNLAYTTNTTPALAWKYKGVTYPYPQPEPTPPTAYTCQPQKFRVSLSMAPLHNVELGGIGPGALTVTWNTPPLQPGQTYRWSVVAISKGQEGFPSETRYFSIGSPCTSVSELNWPSGLWPPYDSIMDTLTPGIQWSGHDSQTCLPQGYVIQYSHTFDFAQYEWTVGIGPGSGYDMKIGPLQNCTTYYWRVAAHLAPQAQLGAGSQMPAPRGPWSDPMRLHVALGGKCMEQPAVLPQEMATLPPGPIPPVSKLWNVIMNANCRAGPGTTYNEKGLATEGFAARIEGRNEDGTWFRLIDPSGISCWVSRIALEVPPDWDAQPILAYPVAPLPPEAPPAEEIPPPGEVIPPEPPLDPCAQYQGAPACLAQPGCFFDRMTGLCRSK